MIRLISVNPTKLRIALPGKQHCAIQFSVIVAAVVTSACSGGGGGGLAGSSGGATSGGGASTTTSSPNTSGPAGVPAAATFGDSPVPAQIATSGGPTFDGSSGSYPSNVSFPVLSSTLQYTSVGASAVTSSQSATATISADSSTVHLVVPSVNLNQTLALSGTPALPIPDGWNQSAAASQPNKDIYASSWGLSYLSLGLWLHSGAKDSTPQITFTAYAFGYETPAAAMPTSGSATYLGPGAVQGVVSGARPIGLGLNPCNCNYWVSGDASFSVDFVSGKMSGSFTNMKFDSDGGFQPWYDISVDASIAAGTNKFSGSTAISPQQSRAIVPQSGTGRIDGAFYGPRAQNLGAIWSLTGTNFSALGGVAAAH